ncbi:unnamed protein product, partial [Rotaria socialis]
MEQNIIINNFDAMDDLDFSIPN